MVLMYFQRWRHEYCTREEILRSVIKKKRKDAAASHFRDIKCSYHTTSITNSSISRIMQIVREQNILEKVLVFYERVKGSVPRRLPWLQNAETQCGNFQL